MTSSSTPADSEPVSFDAPLTAGSFGDDTLTVEMPSPTFGRQAPRGPSAADEGVTVEMPAPSFAEPPPAATAVSFEMSSDELYLTERQVLDQLTSQLSGLERRDKDRAILRVEARIGVEGEPALEAHTIDLSSHGVAITSKKALNVGRECVVELGVSAPEIANPPALRASVCYCAPLGEAEFRIGMKFTAVSIEAAELIVAVLGL